MSKILNDLVELAKRIKETQSDAEFKEQDLSFLVDHIEKIPNYFNSVIAMETKLPIAKFRLEQEAYCDLYKNLDTNRRIAHMAVTNAINGINALSNLYHMKPIFELPEGMEKLKSDDRDDRNLATDMVYQFCKEVFLDSSLREQYNDRETYSTTERENEVYDMIQTGNTFNGKISLDDLIKMSKEEITGQPIHPKKSDDFCL